MDLKKGTILISNDGEFTKFLVKYLGVSQLDSDCFIGEDENGDVYDDFVKNEFEVYKHD